MGWQSAANYAQKSVSRIEDKYARKAAKRQSGMSTVLEAVSLFDSYNANKREFNELADYAKEQNLAWDKDSKKFVGSINDQVVEIGRSDMSAIRDLTKYGDQDFQGIVMKDGQAKDAWKNVQATQDRADARASVPIQEDVSFDEDDFFEPGQMTTPLSQEDIAPTTKDKMPLRGSSFNYSFTKVDEPMEFVAPEGKAGELDKYERQIYDATNFLDWSSLKPDERRSLYSQSLRPNVQMPEEEDEFLTKAEEFGLGDPRNPYLEEKINVEPLPPRPLAQNPLESWQKIMLGGAGYSDSPGRSYVDGDKRPYRRNLK